MHVILVKRPSFQEASFALKGNSPPLNRMRDFPVIAVCTEPPPAGLVPNCQEAGVLGVLAGTIGVLQANEAIKEILGLGETLADRLLLYDALDMTFRKVGRPKDPDCPLCGPHPTITELVAHEVSCSL